MSILPGTPVKLPDGRDGVVLPAPWCTRDRVFVKLRGGRKRWCKLSDCIPALARN
ncbi:MAG: hypothetical protein SFW36_06590 [Leptolyngbyaceae cyanobacterium bins.59]|nr:hypothetical protein [Leptolyngbyaceae cyanobacterium bins.59]